jgi:hypothetical protein
MTALATAAPEYDHRLLIPMLHLIVCLEETETADINYVPHLRTATAAAQADDFP